MSREAMRRTQALRKEAGLQKVDRIECFIKGEKSMIEMLKKFEESIKEKVGAEELMLSEKVPEKEYSHFAKEKIKGKEIEIFIKKI
jgi:bifunctional DNA-binding transcriptional regulator/antitoxin component of YhaV-PrlF toxin-antitoxin module